MAIYSHSQPGKLMRFIFGGLAAASLIVGLVCEIVFHVTVIALWINLGVFAILFMLFHSLNVVVDQDTIYLSYGIGVIKRTLPVSDIVSVTTVRNSGWYGWGIRRYPAGWMWNVDGKDAVELDRRSSDLRFRIGTDEPEELCAAIKHAMG